jgi:hypothetical protein
MPTILPHAAVPLALGLGLGTNALSESMVGSREHLLYIRYGQPPLASISRNRA